VPHAAGAGTDPLEVALAAGRRLVRDALWWGDRCTWMGWTNEVAGGQMRSAFRALGWNLYDGVGGIAVFLARLGRACGDEEIARHARGAVNQLLAFDPDADGEHGLYVGRAGVAWALARAGELLDLPRACDRGVQLLLGTPPATANPDVLSGQAGRLLAQLDLFAATGDPRLASGAAATAERLLALGERGDGGGRRWLMRAINPDVALTGYSHGAAGIAHALFEAAAAFGTAECAAAAEELLGYERACFDPAAGNWRDLRPRAEEPEPEEVAFEVAWCNGAAGVGLARLAMWTRVPDPRFVDEIESAARATRRHLAATPELNSSLCHGLCGNAEFLFDAARLLGRPGLLDGVLARTDTLAGEALENGFALSSGVMSRQDSPGLFLGVAGVGHFFLRMWDPVAVPSLLALQPGRRPIVQADPDS
jgi:lantibiotic modifying enzyme